MYGALQCVRCGDVECIKFLIQKGADVNKTHTTGDSPLLCAAEGGNYECMRVLIDEGADVNHTNDYGYSALWHAVFKGHLKCTQLLIEAGADVNGEKGCEPIMATAFTGNAECMESLIKAGAGVNMTGTSCYLGNPDFDTLDESTPLIDAARFGHQKCVDLLISGGADVNTVSIQGDRALIHALVEGRVNCVDLLIKAGADVNVIDSFGNTPFMLTCHCGVNSAKSLLEAGAKINMVNVLGENALHNMLKLIPADRTMVLFQHAAGETCGWVPEQLRECGKESVLDFLFEENLRFNLKNLCRDTIRQYLLKLDPHRHLFGRVPRLGLPKILTDYLLYNCTSEVESKSCDDSAAEDQ